MAGKFVIHQVAVQRAVGVLVSTLNFKGTTRGDRSESSREASHRSGLVIAEEYNKSYAREKAIDWPDTCVRKT